MVTQRWIAACAGALVSVVAVTLGSNHGGRLQGQSAAEATLPAGVRRPALGADPESGRSVEERTSVRIPVATAQAPVEPARPLRAILAGDREVLVVVADREAEPIPGLELAIERSDGAGAWHTARVGATDAEGRATFVGLYESAHYRVRARFPGAPSPTELGGADAVQLTVERPVAARVELHSASGSPLAGAQRVELQAAGEVGQRSFALAVGSTPGTWELSVARAVEGALRVTDSLGRSWRRTVALRPGETTVATPSAHWFSIARPPGSSASAADRIDRGRLQWSLRLGDEAAQRGSSWLPQDGGFHAVVPRDKARRLGGSLAVSAGLLERDLDCWWFADPSLEHIELPPAPAREAD